jgi:hypothetical protein
MDTHVYFLEKGEGVLQMNAGAKTLPGTSPDKVLTGCGEEDEAMDGERRPTNGQAKTQIAKVSECEKGSQLVGDSGYIRHDCYTHVRDFVASCVRVIVSGVRTRRYIRRGRWECLDSLKHLGIV